MPNTSLDSYYNSLLSEIRSAQAGVISPQSEIIANFGLPPGTDIQPVTLANGATDYTYMLPDGQWSMPVSPGLGSAQSVLQANSLVNQLEAPIPSPILEQLLTGGPQAAANFSMSMGFNPPNYYAPQASTPNVVNNYYSNPTTNTTTQASTPQVAPTQTPLKASASVNSPSSANTAAIAEQALMSMNGANPSQYLPLLNAQASQSPISSQVSNTPLQGSATQNNTSSQTNNNNNNAQQQQQQRQQMFLASALKGQGGNFPPYQVQFPEPNLQPNASPTDPRPTPMINSMLTGAIK